MSCLFRISGDVFSLARLKRSNWQGTASELLPVLTALVPEPASGHREWPKRADTLDDKLRRVASALRRTSIHITFDRGGHARTRYPHRQLRRGRT